MNDFVTDFSNYVLSGHALLQIDTFEKDRAIANIVEVASIIDRKVNIWSVSQGWIDNKGNKVCEVKPTAHVEEHLQAVFGFEENTICILKDLNEYYSRLITSREMRLSLLKAP